MATNTKIVLMDLTDDWNPRTVDKLNYDLQSLKSGIDSALKKLESGTGSGTEHGIPSGGTSNQVLAKASAADYDVHWVNQSGGGGTQVQSDWTEEDDSEPSFIKHKPNNLVQDADYVHTDNNYTHSDKTKLNGIAAGAEVNVQADWDVTDTSSDAYINHKPTIPTKTSDLTNDSDFVESSDLAAVATSGDYNDLTNKPNLATIATSGDYADLSNKPTIPAAQVQSDWSQSDNTKVDFIKSKPSLATVATSGSYNDLSDTPTIPAAPVQSDWAETNTSSLAYIDNKPILADVATTGDYDDLTDTPDLAAVATSGDYSDLSGTPNLAAVATSGDYSDLSGTPSLATVATTGDYDDLTDKPNLATVATSGDYSDLSNTPTIPEPAGVNDTPVMDAATAVVGSSAKYAKADHVHPTDTSRAASSHTHGNITNDGKIAGFGGVSISPGDSLVITDTSSSEEINKSYITFGSSTSTFLANNGTWQTPAGGGGSSGAGAWFGFTYTGASTGDKAITVSGDIEVGAGTSLYVYMWEANTADSLRFIINGGTPYDVYYDGAITSQSNKLTWNAWDVLEFVFEANDGILGDFGWWYVGGSSAMEGEVPSGGTYGQVLTKISNSNFDTAWTGPFPQVHRYESGTAIQSGHLPLTSLQNPIQFPPGPANGDIILVDAKVASSSSNNSMVSYLRFENSQFYEIWYNGKAVAWTIGSSANPIFWQAGSTLIFIAVNVSGSIKMHYIGNTLSVNSSNIWYGYNGSGGDDTSSGTKGVWVEGSANDICKSGTILAMTAHYPNTYTSGAIKLSFIYGSGNSVNYPFPIYVKGAITSASNTLLWNEGDTLMFALWGEHWQYIGGSSAYSGGTQVQADWTETDTDAASYIQNKPTLATVATSGAYSDLSGRPTIPERIGTQLLNKDNVTVAAGTHEIEITGTIESGYSVIGVVGVYMTNASSSGQGVSYAVLTEFQHQSNGAKVTVRNTASSSIKIRVYVRLLLRSTDRGTK